MRQLVGISERASKTSQLAHCAQYIKNLICYRVGLSHTLTFDFYTQSNLLLIRISHTMEPALHCFYDHLTVDIFIHTLKDTHNRHALGPDKDQLNRPHNTLCTTLVNFLINTGTHTITKEIFPIDKSGMMLLTEEGARRLWVATGILKEERQPL